MEEKRITKTFLKDLVYRVNGAAIIVHKELGPGLLESIYKKCMEVELEATGIKFVTELKIPVTYRNKQLDASFKCDLFVEDCLVVELKAVDLIHPIHEAQLLTYMQILKVPIGLIINFNTQNIFYKGQKTYVNELYRNLE